MRRVTSVARSLFALVIVGLIANCADGPTSPTRNDSAAPPISLATASNGAGLSITTDKDDYAPGDTVWFTGAGWTPDDSLDIVLSDSLDIHNWSVGVDEDGGFRDSTYVVDVTDLGVTFTLTATSRTNPEQTLTVAFTDGNVKFITSPASLITSITYTRWNGSAVCTGAPSATGQSLAYNTNLGLQNTQSIQFTVPSVSGYTYSGYSAPGMAVSPASSAAATTLCVTGLLGSGSGTLTLNFQVSNANPSTPSSLAQFKSNGTTAIATGGATNETTVVLKGDVSDPDAGNTVKLQVEVRPIETAFSNTSTGESSLLASGSTAAVTVTGLVNGISYHWQARAMDNNGAASAWVAFGGNTEADTDFLIDTDPPTVTINQGASQVDPTKNSPIVFDVVFNESVSDFATGDVTLSGTAGATTATVSGSGTTYTVSVSGMTGDGTVIASIAADVAHDAAGNGNLASTSTDNTVTYDTTPPAISNFVVNPNPVAVNTSFTLSARFTDDLSKVTGAEYSLNGTWYSLPPAAATQPYGDSKIEDGSYTYTVGLSSADVAEVCVRSTDAATNTNQTSGTNPIQCLFLAVYDPTAGFVTGGGWINSPAGAYAYDPSLTGKATFGFVSKYLKGASVPTGNTEFQFHAASMNFSSTSYDWLVVQGGGAMKATYKGYGTVNGVAGYGFLLSAIDGSPDKFRIKIWDANSYVIYDNQLSGGDNADPTTALAGGSIVINVPKK